ncbi:MAG: NifB/NifX family molybdenum-iron cluster-binding protein [Thermoplasmata archaeon]|nr:NifB/NifX family molybdenum-iron cluster-binding protein [Thermoplasmata archaeon]
MKVAFPTNGYKGLDDEIAEHFGRAPTYTIVDTDGGVKVVENTSEHMGGEGYPPEILAREGVSVLICSGIGRKALSMFQGYKIKVYIAGRRKVREALQDFMDGLLKEACIDDGCVH